MASLREREGNARAAEANAKHITRSAAADVANGR